MAKYFQRKHTFGNVYGHHVFTKILVCGLFWIGGFSWFSTLKCTRQPERITFKIAGGILDSLLFTRGGRQICPEIKRIINGRTKLFVLVEMGLEIYS